MLNREPKMKQYLLKLPPAEWEALVNHLGNKWGAIAQFIRDAIKEKIEKESHGPTNTL
jgi:hypothetical protein